MLTISNTKDILALDNVSGVASDTHLSKALFVGTNRFKSLS